MRATILCCCLLLGGEAAGQRAARGDGFDAFWQKFKAAVVGGDRAAVARLSKFPIGMSYGMRSIRNQADLRRRYREVFNEQTDAARCFANKRPKRDAADPKLYSVACPNEAGDEVVIYLFELTRAGWKFFALDNINE